MLLKYHYHTHTKRCGHAQGEDEEYVLSAIKHGFKFLGFSDHVMLPGHPQPGVRGDYSLLRDYIDSINALKKKYADKIEIHVGFEAEYYPMYVDYYKELLEKEGIEYLILGQHCFINENNKFEFYLDPDNRDERISHHLDDIIKGMSTGLFKYVCHPDYFVRYFKEHEPILDVFTRRLCEACLKYDVPLEINVSGIEPRRPKEDCLTYPCPYFWKIVGEMGVKVVVSCDAHNPNDFEISDFDYAFKLIKDYNLNYIGDYKIC